MDKKLIVLKSAKSLLNKAAKAKTNKQKSAIMSEFCKKMQEYCELEALRKLSKTQKKEFLKYAKFFESKKQFN